MKAKQVAYSRTCQTLKLSGSKDSTAGLDDDIKITAKIHENSTIKINKLILVLLTVNVCMMGVFNVQHEIHILGYAV